MAFDLSTARPVGGFDLSTAKPVAPEPEPGMGDKALGVLETAATIGSSIVAEPASGLAGIAQSLNPFAEDGAGADAVEAVREAMTYEPRTEQGKQYLSSTGETLQPVGEALQKAERWLGDGAYEATGSPAVAALAMTIPTALLEALGQGTAKRIAGAGKQAKKMDQFMAQSAPDVDTLKKSSRAIYKEIDDMGVSIKPDAYAALASRIARETRRKGLDADVTPAANKAVGRFAEKIGEEVNLSELDTLREVAQGAAASLNAKEKMLGSIIIDSVDDFLDKGGSTLFNRVPEGVNLGQRYKVAQRLWGQARRAEMIDDALKQADLQASGLENGIRIQFRQILKNPKKRRFFRDNEIREMDKVVKGTKGANLSKLLGRFGFSEQNATNIIGGSISAGGGAAVGSMIAGPAGGAVGAVVTPIAGQGFRQLAQRLTKNNAQFARQVIKAGPDGREITKAYFSNTPKSQRSAAELGQLLANPDIALDLLDGDGLVGQAAEIAMRQRELTSAAVAGALPAAARRETEDLLREGASVR